jgi:hypothetical protein
MTFDNDTLFLFAFMALLVGYASAIIGLLLALSRPPRPKRDTPIAPADTRAQPDTLAQRGQRCGRTTITDFRTSHSRT